METLAERITRHEGEKLFPYRDSLGFLTIGIGRCLDKKGISHDEALYLLKSDIAESRADLLEYFPWAASLDDVRQEILIEMIFQIGVNGLQGFKNALSYVQSGQWDLAAEAMLNSVWARQTPARASELANLMRTG